MQLRIDLNTSLLFVSVFKETWLWFGHTLRVPLPLQKEQVPWPIPVPAKQWASY